MCSAVHVDRHQYLAAFYLHLQSACTYLLITCGNTFTSVTWHGGPAWISAPRLPQRRGGAFWCPLEPVLGWLEASGSGTCYQLGVTPLFCRGL